MTGLEGFAPEANINRNFSKYLYTLKSNADIEQYTNMTQDDLWVESVKMHEFDSKRPGYLNWKSIAVSTARLTFEN